jgi:hypothetical protein
VLQRCQPWPRALPMASTLIVSERGMVASVWIASAKAKILIADWHACHATVTV